MGVEPSLITLRYLFKHLPIQGFAGNTTNFMTNHALNLQLTLPVLITGVSGVVGFNFFVHMRRKYGASVVGIRPQDTWRMQSEGIIGVNPDDSSEMLALFNKYNFKTVLNATGSCALKACELNKELAYKTNVLSAQVIAKLATQFNSRLVHISSDLVFSGNSGEGNYLEDSPLDPVTMYGKTMVEGEKAILSISPNAAILRISLPMGPSFSGHAGAIDWITSRFKNHKPATLYFDEFRSPTYVEDMNDVFEQFLSASYSGIYHFGGPKNLSLYQIGQIINKAGGFDPNLLQGCLRHEAGPVPPRAGNVTMISEKLTKILGLNKIKPWPFRSHLNPGNMQWHQKREPEFDYSKTHLHENLYRHTWEVPTPSEYYVQDKYRKNQ